MTEPNNEPTIETTAPAENGLSDTLAQLQNQQNLSMAVIAGAVAAIVCAIIWAAVTVASGYQIGWMAIGVGALTGLCVRLLGKGLSTTYGVIGAVFALIGCLLGNLFSIVGFIGQEENLGYIEVLGLIDYAIIPEIMIETFMPMDLLFYGLALYTGFKFSFRQFSDEEIAQIENEA